MGKLIEGRLIVHDAYAAWTLPPLIVMMMMMSAKKKVSLYWLIIKPYIAPDVTKKITS